MKFPFVSFYKLGQLLEIANEIYGLDLKVRILEAENDIIGGTVGPISFGNDTEFKSVVVKYRLDFDNSEYVNHSKRRLNLQELTFLS